MILISKVEINENDITETYNMIKKSHPIENWKNMGKFRKKTHG